jgi:hypothetical protein
MRQRSSMVVGATTVLVLFLLLGVWWSTRAGTAPVAGGAVAAAETSGAVVAGRTSGHGAAAGGAAGAARIADSQVMDGAVEHAAWIPLHREPPAAYQLRGDTQVYAGQQAPMTPPDELPPPPIHVDPSVRGSRSAAWTEAPSR